MRVRAKTTSYNESYNFILAIKSDRQGINFKQTNMIIDFQINKQKQKGRHDRLFYYQQKAKVDGV